MKKFALLSLFPLLMFTQDALACATCFGTPQDAQTQGMNAAIFTLLGVTATVLSVAGGFGAMILLRMKGGA